jgi:hypothetical protein
MSPTFNSSLVNAKIVLLRKLLEDESRYDEAKALLLQVHAWLHTREMAGTESWSYQDTVLDGLTSAQMREIPVDECHSIAWLLWHTTRCEDLTMNLLVAGSAQVLLAEGWQERLNISRRDTGNAMSPGEIIDFSQEIDIPELLGYRKAVGKSTHVVILALSKEMVHRKVAPSGIKRIFDEGGVVEAESGVADYWSKRDFAGLFLMPATRHLLTHLNEVLDINRKLVKR